MTSMAVNRSSVAMLDRLISPIPRIDFMRRYWEKEPLYLAAKAPGRDELPSIGDIEDVLMRSSGSDVRMVRSQAGTASEITAQRTKDGRLDMGQLYRSYDDGWTIVINGLHTTLPGVSRLAAGLSEALSHQVGINLYFTPPRSQGFAPHADGHDVFILQLSGMKKWRIFQPLVRLPLEDQQVKVDRKHLPRRKLDARLRPGNILYIPRGFVHEAMTGKAASSHLTIGIHSLRWADVARHALAVAAERDVALRESVSLRDLASGRCSKELILRTRRLSAILTDSEIAAIAGERARGQIVSISKPAPDGHFAAIDRARSLTLQSTVQRRLGLICRVWCAGRRAFIDFGVNQVDGPAGIEEALRFVALTYRFKVKEMPDVLTSQSKLLLTRRLITEGLLTIP